MTHDTLQSRLDAGPVICAEGYLFELERRGYLQAGPFVPEVVLEHPEAVRENREAVSCHVAALPVIYRTTEAEPTFQALSDRDCACIPDERPFPTALDPFTCNRYECAEFARACSDMDVRYIGLCCGAAPHHVRAVAEAVGKAPPASRYSPDMAKHAFFGTDDAIPEAYRARRTEI